MKGLERIPSQDDLVETYRYLQGRLDDVTCAQLALWSQWTRFDPRLGEVWSDALVRLWEGLNPVLLRSELERQPWPSAVGVLLDQIAEFRFKGIDKYYIFKKWCEFLMHGFEPVPLQSYFIGTRAFASPRMLEDLRGSLGVYLRWGFYGREIFVNKASFSGRTLVPAEGRRRVLDELVRRMPRLCVADYRESLGGWIGARQAEKDLAAHPRLTARGNTRARFYVRKGR